MGIVGITKPDRKINSRICLSVFLSIGITFLLELPSLKLIRQIVHVIKPLLHMLDLTDHKDSLVMRLCGYVVMWLCDYVIAVICVL